MTGIEIAAGVAALASVGSAAYGAVSSSSAGNTNDNLPTPVTRNDPAIEDARRDRTRQRALATGYGGNRMSLTTPLGTGSTGGRTTARPTLVGEVGG